MLLVDVNHHHQTIIFGSALLNVEIEEAYTWLPQTFHEGMNNKSPILVIIDGDTMPPYIQTFHEGNAQYYQDNFPKCELLTLFMEFGTQCNLTYHE